MLGPLLAVVICYNGQEVMYKGRDYVYVQYITEMVRDEKGVSIEPPIYNERCDVGTLDGTHYVCTDCDILSDKGDKK